MPVVPDGAVDHRAPSTVEAAACAKAPWTVSTPTDGEWATNPSQLGVCGPSHRGGTLTDTSRDLTLVDATLADGRRFGVTLVGGRIVGMRPVGSVPTRDGASLACGGRLLEPSFVEGHVHLDKTLLGLPLVPHRPGATVADRVRNEEELRRTLPLSIEERGGRLIE